MGKPSETRNIAVFCDFENIALGVEQARYERFDVHRVLERLLLKGNIVVKKAYCDWTRYRPFKAAMHEAAFELIDIPHTRQAGKNSADIRMVVDALDLCYTKAHVDTFAIISGDSDFSPLVSKLRENNKYVIGVGVRSSSSDLLIRNCDEFIFYDDLAQASPRAAARRKRGAAAELPAGSAPRATDRKEEAIGLVVDTYEALVEERGEEEKIWGSMIKQALKRRNPGFSERAYGFRSFGELLREAARRGRLDVELDEKSGGAIVRRPRER